MPSYSPASGVSVPDTFATVGAPTTGTWTAGQSIIDANGVIWTCLTGGKFPAAPPLFVPGGSGVELGEAELSADFALTSTALADITGLSITIPAAPARAFVVEATFPPLALGAVAQYCQLFISDSAGVGIADGYSITGSGVQLGSNVVLRARLPRIGGGTSAYPIVPGNPYTFKCQYAMSSVAGGNGNLATTIGVQGQSRPILRAVTC